MKRLMKIFFFVLAAGIIIGANTLGYAKTDFVVNQANTEMKGMEDKGMNGMDMKNMEMMMKCMAMMKDMDMKDMDKMMPKDGAQ